MARSFAPFDYLNLQDNICFLSGKKSDLFIPVFPEWLINRFHLQNRSIALPDGRPVAYTAITLPVAFETAVPVKAMQDKMQAYFTGGFSQMKQADNLGIFQFTGLILYGIIWHELRSAIIQEKAAGSGFSLSNNLLKRFANLHLMLQSLILPTEFDEPLPWSAQLFEVHNEPEEFGFKDEISTLFLSIRTLDFGLIMLMQDGGLNALYHQKILRKISSQKLTPVQFEELNARFLYSAYLQQSPVNLSVMEAGDVTYIEAEPAEAIGGRPAFEPWVEKTYAQILENFWKPWGYTLFEIRKDPENPMSFL